MAWAAAALLASQVSIAACPVLPPPEECDNNGDFVGGRWDISQRLGDYTLAGTETFYWPEYDPDGSHLKDDFDTGGILAVEIVGGPDQNFLEVACDGTVTGQGRELISGIIDKTYVVPADECNFLTTEKDMQWNVTVDRRYSITGSVTGFGQLELELTVEEATMNATGMLTAQIDGFCKSQPQSIVDLDVAGDIERIRLAGGYDPENGMYEPQITALDARSWLDDIFHRIALNFVWPGLISQHSISPVLEPSGFVQPPFQKHNEYFIQDAVTVTDALEIKSESTAPIILSLVLQEPAQYLVDVPVDSEVVATINWRGKTPGTVEFTYGGTTETLPGADSVSWTFNAGEPGTSIEVVAIGSEADSAPFSVATPKVSVPGWAGSAADWSGTPGIQYAAVLDWPVTLETTRTLDTISLFSGLWGISGALSSEFNATALSSGSPGSGEMTTDANFRIAGKSLDLQLTGPNQTTLTCDELTTDGSATAIIPLFKWQQTINPLTLIPGLQAAACGLSGFLCDVINSIGIKASANASIAGTPTYIGQADELQWDGGSLGGSLGAGIGFEAGLPKPLKKIANLSVYGGAEGCIDFTVAPSLALTTLGGELNAGAMVSFFGLSAAVDEQWPFGDVCGFRNPRGVAGGPDSAWIPADGQVAMAASFVSGDIRGIVVWSELPTGQARPSGDIHYRFFAQDQWGPIHELTDDAESDTAPAVAFDDQGNAVIVYMRSDAALPTQTSDLAAFADSLELEWAVLDPTTGQPVARGALTTNGMNDFGPQLVRDGTGGLHLFWQRAFGIEIAGTATDPVAILSSSFDAVQQNWGVEQTVAGGLVSTFGWSAAALSSDRMLVGLVVDSDGDYSTGLDREVSRIESTGGIWSDPIQITANSINDDSVLAAFDASGLATLLWRSGTEVVELRGNMLGAPAPAFNSPSPDVDDGIGMQFANGVISASASGMTVMWTEGIEALATAEAGTAWAPPAAALDSGLVESIISLRSDGNSHVLGYTLRSFESDGFTPSDFVTPHFDFLGGNTVFTDSFEPLQSD